MAPSYSREELYADFIDSENAIISSMAASLNAEDQTLISTTPVVSNPLCFVKPFRYLALPAEIRQKIVGHLLPEEPVSLSWTSRGVCQRDNLNVQRHDKSAQHLSSILAASKIMRSDLLAIIASRCTVTFTVDASEKLQQGIRKLPLGMLATVRRLEVIFSKGMALASNVTDDLMHAINAIQRLNRVSVLIPTSWDAKEFCHCLDAGMARTSEEKVQAMEAWQMQDRKRVRVGAEELAY